MIIPELVQTLYYGVSPSIFMENLIAQTLGAMYTYGPSYSATIMYLMSRLLI